MKRIAILSLGLALLGALAAPNASSASGVDRVAGGGHVAFSIGGLTASFDFGSGVVSGPNGEDPRGAFTVVFQSGNLISKGKITVRVTCLNVFPVPSEGVGQATFGGEVISSTTPSFDEGDGVFAAATDQPDTFGNSSPLPAPPPENGCTFVSGGFPLTRGNITITNAVD
jgi:hypothetical protein